MEYSYSYFRLFFPEVMDFTREVLRNHIDGTISDELAIDVFERALDLGFSRSDNVFFLSKMSEAYIRIGDAHAARLCIDEIHNL